MGNIEDQIKELEDEIFRTQKNKATEHHIGKLKAKIAKLKQEQEKRRVASSGGGGDKGYYVKKSGNGTVALVGFPSVGKSTLLNKFTDAESEVGAYDFTTLTVVPGQMDYRGAKIQILDLPGLIEGASKGKGRGREVIAAARAADLVVLLVDVFRYDMRILLRELVDSGLRLNERPVDVKVTRTHRGGITVAKTVELTHMTSEQVHDIVKSFGVVNADVVVREDITHDQLIDLLTGNKVYVRAIVALNKIDLLSEEELQPVYEALKDWEVIPISAQTDVNLDKLQEGIFDALSFIRVYLKPQRQKADLEEPLVITSPATVGTVCDHLHRDFREKFRYAQVWGPSGKFPGQMVGLDHVMEDEDVLMVVIRK